jgi:hypothetical protein
VAVVVKNDDAASLDHRDEKRGIPCDRSRIVRTIDIQHVDPGLTAVTSVELRKNVPAAAFDYFNLSGVVGLGDVSACSQLDIRQFWVIFGFFVVLRAPSERID